VIRRYFFEQHKMADIAADLGVTESRVSQLRAEALTMLRSGMQATSAPKSPKRAASGCRSRAAREDYLFAVATRSTLKQRLASTTLLGEPIRLLPRLSAART
jgi:RNA polymerase sigma factor for flagellar operon FliA